MSASFATETPTPKPRTMVRTAGTPKIRQKHRRYKPPQVKKYQDFKSRSTKKRLHAATEAAGTIVSVQLLDRKYSFFVDSDELVLGFAGVCDTDGAKAYRSLKSPPTC